MKGAKCTFEQTSGKSAKDLTECTVARKDENRCLFTCLLTLPAGEITGWRNAPRL